MNKLITILLLIIATSIIIFFIYLATKNYRDKIREYDEQTEAIEWALSLLRHPDWDNLKDMPLKHLDVTSLKRPTYLSKFDSNLTVIDAIWVLRLMLKNIPYKIAIDILD